MNKRQTSGDYTDDYAGDKVTRLKSREVVKHVHDYYLSGEIGEAHNYLDLCEVLRKASEHDEITIRINSGGGFISTGNQIINAINDSEAHVRGYIESSCGSMATMIFLACHSWAVSDNAEFFIHTSSGGMFGKESETFAQAVFTRKKTHSMIKKCYTGFLSDAEVTKVLEGTDLYFDAEEILERLDNFVEHYRNTVVAQPEKELAPVATSKKLMH